jgi:catechol 2,3-dioxygenase-like lactoylglutathione lyase family enzyme
LGNVPGLPLEENPMSDPNFVILYVDNPVASAAFYADLLGRPPLEASPTFAMFSLHADVMLGLWSRHTVEPKATVGGGGAEIAIAVDSDAAVAALHTLWRAKGLPVVQAPVDLDFGRTFVALDPDGHRLRVFAPH